jgi:para-aminobenzoate synthetase component 1
MTRVSTRRSALRCEELPLAPPHRVARELRARGERGVSLLESALDVDGLGRFSFVAARPSERVVGLDLAALRSVLERRRPAEDLAARAGVPFAGGAVLVLSYDYGRRLERWPSRAKPLAGAAPTLVAHIYDAVLAWDHARGRALYLGTDARGGLPLSVAREAASAASDPSTPPRRLRRRGVAQGERLVAWNFTPATYRQAVAKVRRYIRAGDVFQVNISQRFEAACADPDLLYERLREVSPAPFMADVDLGEWGRVLSSSPERFLRLDRRGRVESWPIKGTRPRGATKAADEKQRRALLASKKEAAELAMIVDLVRNDLGRVDRAGSVRVEEARRAQAWPTVHHTVGVVSAQLEESARWDELVSAAFPPASVTGAPKLRACEIIDELEPCRRGVYTGALGWVSWQGALDLAVLIRTLHVRGGRAAGNVGGGVTLRSKPAAEHAETLAKARGMLRALGASS